MNNFLAQPSGATNKGPNKSAIARIFGIKDSDVTYLDKRLPIDGYKVLFDPSTQMCFWNTNGTGTPTSWSVTGDTLTLVTSAGSFTSKVANKSSARTVNSFTELRTITPDYEGQEIILLSYNSGNDSGGGTFIGHLNNGVDDSGVTAASNNTAGYHWVRKETNDITPDFFGAVGDGATDDTVAIQSFVSFCKLNNVTIKLNKRFLISQGISLFDNASLIGQGNNTGFIVNNAVSALNIIYSNNDNVTIKNFSINFTSNGNGTVSSTWIYGIFIDSLSTNNQITNVFINGNYQGIMGYNVGVRLTGVNNSISNSNIRNCSMGMTVRGDKLLIEGNYCSNHFVDNNLSTWDSTSFYWDGICCEGITNTKILNNTCEYNGQSGIYIGGGGSGLSYNIIITGNIVRYNFNRGIDLGVSGTPSLTNNVYNIIVTSNQLYNNKEANIWLYAVSKSIVSTNRIVQDLSYRTSFGLQVSSSMSAIALGNSPYCVNNIIEDNIADLDASAAFGIVMNGYGNTIRRNKVSGAKNYVFNNVIKRIWWRNNLDTYSGTFTPQIVGAVNVTLSSSTGTYTVEGNKLKFNLSVSLTANGTPSGNISIGYIPGLTNNIRILSSEISIPSYNGFASSTFGSSQLQGVIDQTSIGLIAIGRRNNGVVTYDLAASVSTNTIISIAGEIDIEQPTITQKVSLFGHSFLSDQYFADALGTNLSLPVYNFARGGSSSQEAAIIEGGTKLNVTVSGGAIPASGVVNLTLVDTTLGLLWSGASFQCTVAGVTGTAFSVMNDSTDYTKGTYLQFTRSVAGSQVSVSGTQVVKPLPLTRQVTTSVPINTENFDHINDINILWIGRNTNGGNITQILSDLRSIVSTLPTSKFVICPEFPYDTETTGTAAATNIANLNTQLKSIYPDNYCQIGGIDLLQNFNNHYNPAYAQDVTDIGNGITPSSLRKDNLHPSDSVQTNALYAGVQVNADFISSFIKNKGWVIE